MADLALKEVQLVHPDGELVYVPETEVPKALQSGFTEPSPELLEEQANEAQYGGLKGTLQAVGLGAARTATFGLSDYFAPNAEQAKQLEERHPIATTVGEVGGILADPLGAVGLVSKAGKATETAAKVLSSPGAKAAGSAVEGAAFGLGNVVSEHALGDPDLTAERVASHIGTSALFGAGLGAALGLGEKALPPAIGAAKSALARTNEALGTAPVVDSIKNMAAKGYAEAASVVSGHSPEEILAAIKNRGISGQPLEASEIAKNLDSQYSALDKAKNVAFKDIRPAEVSNLLTNVDHEGVQKEFERVYQGLGSTIQEMKSQPELYPARYPFKLEQIRDGLSKKVSLTSSPEEVFNALNDFKQQLDTNIKFGKIPSEESLDAIASIKNLRQEVKASLENDKVFGPAGARQAAFNDSVSDYLKAQKEFQSQFMYKSASKGGAVVYKIDPAKVENFLKRVDSSKGVRGAQALSNYTNSSKSLLEQIEETYKAVPEKSFDKDSIKNLIAQNEQVIEANKQQALLNRMAQKAGQEGAAGLLEGGLVGGMAGSAAATLGIPLHTLAPIVTGYSALRYPGITIQRLAKLEDAANKTFQQVIKGTKALAKPVLPVAEATKGYIASKMAASDSSYDKRVKQLQDHASLEGVSDLLAKNTSSLQPHAPNITSSLNTLGVRAGTFLHSKIPQNPQPGPLAPKQEPSPAQKASFNRYYEAVEHPLSILKDAEHGALTHEGIEAVQTVYPKLYEQIQKHLMDEITEIKEPIPYQRRMMLTMILGTDLDGSMKSQSIMENQAMLGMAGLQQQQKNAAFVGQSKPRAKGLDKMTFSERTLTHTQAVNQRQR